MGLFYTAPESTRGSSVILTTSTGTVVLVPGTEVLVLVLETWVLVLETEVLVLE